MCAGGDGRSFEEIFQVPIVIVIQTAHPAVLSAIVSFHGETAVGPQLALGAKTVRGLQQCYQQGCSDRANRRNLAKSIDRRMLVALPQ